jgi:DNA processing protein
VVRGVAVTAGRADPAWRASERRARAALSCLAEPGDLTLGVLLRSRPAADVLAGLADGETAGADLFGPGAAGLGLARISPGLAEQTLTRMRSRLRELPAPAWLDRWESDGFRLVCPDEPEWPTQLEDLGYAKPVALWMRGQADLRFACLRSVAVVGARAATAYGTLVATELAADLAERAITVVSGGAYGVDAGAHRGALAAGGSTIAVLASGLAFGYPRGHAELFGAISETGVLVSESPPEKAPTRPGFLIRNRLIAALSRGTVVVEAALRSGALNTAKHARELNRPVMAVPGPVTSAQSAGCHELIRDTGAICVTGAADVFELIAPLGEAEGDLVSGPILPAEQLDPVTAAVLRTMNTRTGRGPATIATLAGVDLDTAMRCLGLLSAAGLTERCDQGWRVRRSK